MTTGKSLGSPSFAYFYGRIFVSFAPPKLRLRNNEREDGRRISRRENGKKLKLKRRGEEFFDIYFLFENSKNDVCMRCASVTLKCLLGEARTIKSASAVTCSHALKR